MVERIRSLDALAGLVAAAVALGVAELAAGLLGRVSLVVSVGDLIVDTLPAPLVKLAIEVFGTYDKPALLVTIVAVSLGVGAMLGPAVARRPRVGVAAFVTFAVVGTLAGASDTRTLGIVAALIAGVGAWAGWRTLRWLLEAAEPSTVAAMPGRGVADRRRFLAFAGAASAGAVTAAVVGRRAGSPVDVEAQRTALVLPEVTASTPVEVPGLPVEGITPLVTPNDRFYRIDTALVVPRVDVSTWRLRVTGLVDAPFEITFDELAEMATLNEAVTLVCVSNEVGGNLAGNAVWLGVPLTAILGRAGVRREATQIVGRSVDGFTVGFPTAVLADGRPAMVAIGMNGEPLPADHGFPARLVVPGLYGYVSATKWLQEIELTTLEAFDAYWIPRGWAKEAPIKTQSRIDVPRTGRAIVPGRRPIAGVAWGGIRSVSRVEVAIRPKVDGEYVAAEWREATLGEVLAQSTWRQWVLEWDAAPGEYEIAVRATDGEGNVQTEVESRPDPDGATGHHTIRVRVEA
ncbi:MAG: oxidoreductase [Chloroflexota bacterium]